MTVQARDQRTNEKFATQNVIVNVIVSNQLSPVFVNQPYQFGVSENALTSTVVYRVTAEDRDLQVIYLSSGLQIEGPGLFAFSFGRLHIKF